MLGCIVYSYIILIAATNIRALPAPMPDEIHAVVRPQQKQSIVAPPDECDSCQSLNTMMRATKDAGLTAVDRLTDAASCIVSTVGDIASHAFNVGLQHTVDFIACGQDAVANNIEDVKRIGQRGIHLVDEAVTATGDFIVDSFSKLPFLEYGQKYESRTNEQRIKCHEKRDIGRSFWSSFFDTSC